MAFADKKRTVEYNNAYNAEHYERLRITVRRGCGQIIEAAAADAGLSKNAYMKEAISDRLRADGFTVPDDF